MDYLHQLEKILESKYRIITIESYDTDRVLDLFIQVSRFSNKAFYNAKHYGVYILRDFDEELEKKPNIALLKEIATGSTPKVVILLSEYLNIPRELKPYVLRSKHQLKKAG